MWQYSQLARCFQELLEEDDENLPLKITKEEGGNNKNGYAKVRTYPRQV